MKKKAISQERLEWDLEPDEEGLVKTASIADSNERERHIKDLVARGSILSMLNLAHFYEYRRAKNGGPDLVSAEAWYQKAVESGSAVATFNAGYFYLRRKNYEKAREIFSVGMDRGYAPAIVRLADLYVHGLGVEKDYDRAKELYKRAAKNGNLWAKAALGAMTASLASSVWVRCKGYVMVALAGIQIRFQKWREPLSERLKK
ncbi:tetratricopeptide repeat protein [Paraburkholderia tuberum]|uniref:Sel1 repeat-containing protein n=1 Tax=Paraburkholderia tuberum TaxID=157910 RepID=A0A1H1JM01_9BURK|nr:tetratricopeptide repeat protein [Paraburkholderia tuberum]SDR50940.1 Sel1 repeat-containing protein [Paraburkholderia tuberum]